MDANIKTTQDALEWLDRSIREEVELDGEMSNTHAIQLGFIQNMLAKFPRRNCDRFASAEEAMEYHKRTNCAARRYCAYRDGCPTDGSCVVNWLLAKATEGGTK